MNEKNEGSGKFDRFEEWMPGDGNRTALPRAQGQQKRLFRSAGSSVAENVTAGGGLKVGGLVKKVCHSFPHFHNNCLTEESDNHRENRWLGPPSHCLLHPTRHRHGTLQADVNVVRYHEFGLAPAYFLLLRISNTS